MKIIPKFFHSLMFLIIILLIFNNIGIFFIKQADNSIVIADSTNKNFSFKWSYDMDLEDPGTKIGPLSVDVNDDGIYEVFATGKNKVVCIDGASGSLIWEYHGIWSQHTPFEIHDLNNDGIPELVISASLRTIALHANNGSVYWNVKVESSNKHLVIADIDGSGFPYVYICSDDLDHGANGTGRLRKLRGTDGKVLKEVFAWYPCFGGLSLAYDAHDGRFKVYMTDRAYGSSNPYAKGMQCYDAETLELLWYEDEVWCASHCMAIVDVNSDRILDAVALHQSGGIYVIDGSTGKKMPDKCSKSLGLKAHSSFSIYDIDGDGNLELCTCCVSSVKVWDLGRWELDATLAVASDPPMMADVIGDSDLEIICVGSKVNIYDGTYTLVETLDIGGRTTLVQDIDGDGLNEFILLSESGLMRVYDTLAIAPTPRVRTNSLYYSEMRNGAGVYIAPAEQKISIKQNTKPSTSSGSSQPSTSSGSSQPSTSSGSSKTSSYSSSHTQTDKIQQNNPPAIPFITGEINLTVGKDYTFSLTTYDNESDKIRFRVYWGDKNVSDWTDYVKSNVTIEMNHTWTSNCSICNLSVIAQDEKGLNSTMYRTLTIYDISNIDNKNQSEFSELIVDDVSEKFVDTQILQKNDNRPWFFIFPFLALILLFNIIVLKFARINLIDKFNENNNLINKKKINLKKKAIFYVSNEKNQNETQNFYSFDNTIEEKVDNLINKFNNEIKNQIIFLDYEQEN